MQQTPLFDGSRMSFSDLVRMVTELRRSLRIFNEAILILAAEMLVGDAFPEFNEVLALAYMERNKIGGSSWAISKRTKSAKCWRSLPPCLPLQPEHHSALIIYYLSPRPSLLSVAPLSSSFRISQNGGCRSVFEASRRAPVLPRANMGALQLSRRWRRTKWLKF
jgi:hypothetical protein